MKNILIVIVAFIAVFLIVINSWEGPPGRYYNCRDIDFHPDVPPQVKIECRKIIKDRLDQQRKQERDRSETII
jgi:hypothetical protein